MDSSIPLPAHALVSGGKVKVPPAIIYTSLRRPQFGWHFPGRKQVRSFLKQVTDKKSNVSLPGWAWGTSPTHPSPTRQASNCWRACQSI